MTRYDKDYDIDAQTIMYIPSPASELFGSCEHEIEGRCLSCTILTYLDEVVER